VAIGGEGCDGPYCDEYVNIAVVVAVAIGIQVTGMVKLHGPLQRLLGECLTIIKMACQ